MRSYTTLSISAITTLLLTGVSCSPLQVELTEEEANMYLENDAERADQVAVQDTFKPVGQPSELSPGLLETEFVAITFPANVGVVEQLKPGYIVATTASDGISDTEIEGDEFRVELRYGAMDVDEERAAFRAQYINATEEIVMSQYALQGSADNGEMFQYAIGYLWEFQLGRMLVINGYANTQNGIAEAQRYIEQEMYYQWIFAAERK